MTAGREQDARETGWRCRTCGWATTDPEVMKRDATWPAGRMAIDLVCPGCGTEGNFADHEPRVESIAAKVHEAWMDAKRAQGVESRPSEWGEERMVPYADLSERAKDLDRSTVVAVLDAMDAALDAPARRCSRRCSEMHQYDEQCEKGLAASSPPATTGAERLHDRDSVTHGGTDPACWCASPPATDGDAADGGES